jgi:Predicted hydrolases or acyltransferases (alpha/beta hydrolase superfamily)
MIVVNPQPPLEQGHILLPDGRELAWSRWGTSKKSAVLFCTGAGMSGSLAFAEADLDAHGICLIGIDRPGLGRSTPNPAGTLTTWASDVRLLTDSLHLRDVRAVGFSQGAPFALQLGAVEAVRAVAVVAGQDDFHFEKVFRQLSPSVTEMINQLCSNRQGFKSTIEASANADWLRTMIMTMSSEVDRRIYGDEPFASAYRRCLEEGFSKGAEGYSNDLLNTWSPWPFQLEDLRVPVDVWYGKQDTSPVHSPDFGATMISRLHDGRYFLEEESGSSILWTSGRRILAELLTR